MRRLPVWRAPVPVVEPCAGIIGQFAGRLGHHASRPRASEHRWTEVKHTRNEPLAIGDGRKPGALSPRARPGFEPPITQDELCIVIPSAEVVCARIPRREPPRFSGRSSSAASPDSRKTSPAGPIASLELDRVADVMTDEDRARRRARR